MVGLNRMFTGGITGVLTHGQMAVDQTDVGKWRTGKWIPFQVVLISQPSTVVSTLRNQPESDRQEDDFNEVPSQKKMRVPVGLGSEAGCFSGVPSRKVF